MRSVPLFLIRIGVCLVMGLIPILLMIFNQFDTKVLNRKYRYASKCYVLCNVLERDVAGLTGVSQVERFTCEFVGLVRVACD